MKCEICGKEFKCLGQHIISHNLTIKEYFDIYLKKDGEGLCPICGKPTKFTNRLKYGYLETCDNKECINKNKRLKIKTTLYQKYGDENYNNRELAKQTCKERYGEEYFYKSEYFKEQSKKTKLEKYDNETFINPKKIWDSRYKKINEFEVNNNCTASKTLVKLYGQGWLSLNIEKIYYNGNIFISNDYISQIKNYASISHVNHIKASKLKNHNDENFINLQKIKTTKLKKYGKLAINTWIGRKSNLYKFEIKNNCTLISKLINKYGQGWLSLNLPKIYSNKQNCFISNDYIPIIEQYINENHSKSYSKAEKDIINFIQTFYSNIIIENSRKIIYPLELDIYLPDIKLAIEYNGIYFHSIEHGISKDYHLNKSLKCRDLGIRLIHIYEFEDFNVQLQLLKNLILGIDNYPKNDFNKNNLLKNIPKPICIYNNTKYTIYGAGKLIGGKM